MIWRGKRREEAVNVNVNVIVIKERERRIQVKHNPISIAKGLGRIAEESWRILDYIRHDGWTRGDDMT
jgi:hypothetical protein